jgi:hypothetical protein
MDPPPNRFVSQKRDGYENARPVSKRSVKLIPTAQ